MKYLILADADENGEFGRAWWMVEAHSPPAAVGQVAHMVTHNESFEVFEVKEAPTKVLANVTFEMDSKGKPA